MELKGYKRPDGRVGFRNHVLILPTVMCSVSVAHSISQEIPGTITVPNDSGCLLLGRDKEIYGRTLVNTAGNPNVAATLVIGLGCELFSAEQIAEQIERFGKPVRHLTIHQVGGTINTVNQGVSIAQQLVTEASTLEMEAATVADLVVGLECGGSDPASGLTANSALGVAVDRIVDEGGSAIIGETEECVGAEMLMAANAKTEAVGERIQEVVKRTEHRLSMYGIDLTSEQPIPVNIQAGISTLEEKSLGCLRKIGTRPIVEVLEYSEIPNQKGPILMDTPSFDALSVTGFVASGCQVIVFTTGVGNPFGTAVTPVVKVLSNTPAYNRMRDNTDINAGTILEGTETVEEVGEQMYNMIVQVANGQQTKAEILGDNQFAVWRTTTQA
ncbi:UxaA family hydrolase [Chloroflexota bacterium]